MARYVTRKESSEKAGRWDDEPLLPSLTVDGPKEVATGLFDAHGNPIYRLPPPIGFGRMADW